MFLKETADEVTMETEDIVISIKIAIRSTLEEMGRAKKEREMPDLFDQLQRIRDTM